MANRAAGNDSADPLSFFFALNGVFDSTNR
jgi:hypothetical protein